MTDRRIIIHEGPDGFGRHFFTMEWTEPNGVFRPELSRDGKPVGYRRGQCFRAKLESYQQPGDIIVDERLNQEKPK